MLLELRKGLWYRPAPGKLGPGSQHISLSVVLSHIQSHMQWEHVTNEDFPTPPESCLIGIC